MFACMLECLLDRQTDRQTGHGPHQFAPDSDSHGVNRWIGLNFTFGIRNELLDFEAKTCGLRAGRMQGPSRLADSDLISSHLLASARRCVFGGMDTRQGGFGLGVMRAWDDELAGWLVRLMKLFRRLLWSMILFIYLFIMISMKSLLIIVLAMLFLPCRAIAFKAMELYTAVLIFRGHESIDGGFR